MDRGSTVRTVEVRSTRRTARGRTNAHRAIRARATGPRRTDAFGTALGTLNLVRRVAWIPERAPRSAAWAPVPDVQFDLDHAVAPPVVVDGVGVRFGPVHTVFVTVALGGRPTARDQHLLAAALDAVERAYPWGPHGCVTHVAYGLPYFRRLRAGLVALHMPRLLSDNDRYVLEEAGPGAGGGPGAGSARIERNDLLITLRADNPAYLRDVLRWLGGSGTLAGRPVPFPKLDCGLRVTSTRAMFSQPGLPRLLAADRRLPFRFRLDPRARMWIQAGDQPGELACRAVDVTFGGTHGSHLTTAGPGDYFDNGAIQHLAHAVVDLRRIPDAPVLRPDTTDGDTSYLDRVRYMFRTVPPAMPTGMPSGLPGGGVRAGAVHARHRLGHAACLRESRLPGARPPHQCVDGPGYDNLDVADGLARPKWQFSVFVPTAAHVAATRWPGPTPRSTTTRQQNFLVPPRRHRAFPLLELT